MRNYLLPILAGIFVLVAVPLTVYLAANPGIVADLRRRASTPTGTAEVRLDPATATMANVGDTTTVAVKLDLKGNNMAAGQVRLRYSYSGGANPEISAARPVGGTTDLIYITRAATVDPSAKTVTIDVAAYADATSFPNGYNPGAEFTFATFQLTANAVGSISVNFDTANSKINQKGGSGQDVLLTPTSTGTYSMGTTGVTPTPTTVVTPALSPTPSATPTVTPAVSPTPTPSFHLSCVSNACVQIAGAGSNTGGCTVQGATCGTTTRGFHFECRSNTCVRITGDGNDTGGCSVEGAGCLYQHKTCSNNACVTAYCSPDSSPCADSCTTNASCSTTTTTTTTVTTPTPTRAATATLPVTGTTENTLMLLGLGTLLLLGAKVLFSL